MGLYFRKRIKILPGVHMNISKSGTSWSVGPRGAKVNFGKRGTYVTTGIPGTGIYSRTKVSSNGISNRRMQSSNIDSGYEIKNYTGCLSRRYAMRLQSYCRFAVCTSLYLYFLL